MIMGYSTLKCTEFVEVLASKAPVPGGGGASALVGAIGTAPVSYTHLAATGRTLVLGWKCPETAKAALEVCKDGKPVLNGADASNYEEMSKIAAEAGVVLGVSGASLDELYDTVAALEKLGNKNLVLDLSLIHI